MSPILPGGKGANCASFESQQLGLELKVKLAPRRCVAAIMVISWRAGRQGLIAPVGGAVHRPHLTAPYYRQFCPGTHWKRKLVAPTGALNISPPISELAYGSEEDGFLKVYREYMEVRCAGSPLTCAGSQLQACKLAARQGGSPWVAAPTMHPNQGSRHFLDTFFPGCLKP